ncbi:MAG: YdcF family protein [Bacteroidetes bacterium]|nr:YdcF family protein [Bacteroidota bacterium]MBS1740247.1 YdcF family protein [Bacteroidota bacterium]MBS1776819.1 YdcF family protein [Bacteroidota bacterium]
MRNKFFLLVAILFGSLSWSGCISFKRGPAEALATAHKMKAFDAVIVPGIPFKNGHWDSVMKARVMWSFILYKNGMVKNIIYSGSAVYSPFKEAKIMGLYAQKLGIPKAHIFYDTLARHSTENIYYSYLLAQKLGFKSLALATDPVQSFFLRGFTRRRFASPIYHLPFVMDSVRAYAGYNPEINPSSAKVDQFEALTSQEGFFRRFKGTLGKDIDWAKYNDKRLAPL